MARKRLLGELLVESGSLSKENRDKALKEQKRLGKRLGEVLVQMGLLSEEAMARTLGRQLDMPYKSLRQVTIEPAVLGIVPETIARKHKILPIEVKGGNLVVAMGDPLDVFALDTARHFTKLALVPVVVQETELLKALDRYYRGASEEAMLAAETSFNQEEKNAPLPIETESEDSPTVRLVNTVIAQAIKERASDIHVEPYADSIRIRFRVDGVLHDVMRPSKNLHAGFLSRVKILAGMDIAEKRVPQDGRFNMDVEGRQFDIRTSTLPTLYGEKVVLRLLEKTSGLPKLSELGFSTQMFERFEVMITRPYGMILSTGPTGSGKTTTMYSSLSSISTSERNIITVEDPIEYNLRDINQVQVNPKAGLTFASGLRSILRQDPDIILIGEIRDLETASIATHAALTGHLVLSTLHTNESVGAIARLIDMGVEPFLVTSSLVGVLGQRLIRKICPYCKETYEADVDFDKEVGVKGSVTLSRGRGCAECRQTGYLGREGLFELLSISEGVKRLIVQKASASVIKELALKEGFRTMKHEGLAKALQGVTTYEEVMRVAQETE